MEEARAVLPWFVPWAPVVVQAPLFLALGFVLSWAAARGALAPLRRVREGHWTERARRIFPAGTAVGALWLLLPILAGWWAARLSGPLFHVRGTAHVLLVAAATWLGAAVAAWRFERLVGRGRQGFGAFLRSVAAVYVFFAPVLPCLAFLLVFMPHRLGWRALLVFSAVAFLLALLTRDGGFALAARVGLAAPAEERVLTAVSRAAALAGRPVPRTWEVPLAVPNALAHVTSGQLAFSRGIVDLLSDDELTAVAAHELAHLAESKSVVRARVVGVFAMLPFGAVVPIVASWGPVAFLVMLAVLLSTLSLIGRRSRQWESEADDCSIRVSDPVVYARALERLYEEALLPAVNLGGGGTHPALYDRLTAAGVVPAYPRPAPPSRVRLFAAIFTVFCLVTIVLALADTLAKFPPDGTPRGLLLAAAAHTGGTGDGLHLLGHDFDERGEPEAAAAVFAAAAGLESGPRSAIDRAEVLARLGRCGDAGSALAFAFGRSRPERRLDDDFVEARDAVGACRDGVRRDRPTASE